MKEASKINLKKHTSPPASKMYLLKIVFYILFLGTLLYLVFAKTQSPQSAVEIDGTNIHLEK